MRSSADLLIQELSLWQDAGHKLQLWWRDDDAIQVTPALHQLLEIQQKTAIPLSLAVIPNKLHQSLPDLLKTYPGSLAILQHGIAHQNNALPDQKKIELGGGLGPQECKNGLIKGMENLHYYFPDLFVPILVPPWNRLDLSLLSAIQSITLPYRFVAFSLFGTNIQKTKIKYINTHIDIINWSTRCFIGYDLLLDRLRETAHYLREHQQWFEPIGLLSHHLVHEAACWEGLELFLTTWHASKHIHWLSINQIIDPDGRDAVR